MRKPSSVVSVRALVAALALAAVPAALVPATARAAELPATAVTDHTLLVAWLDVASITENDVAEQLAKFQANAAALDPKQKEKAEKVVKALVGLRQQFLAAGGEGVLITMAEPAKEDDKPEASLLLKSKAGADRASFEKMIHGLSPMVKENNQAASALLSAKVEKYGDSAVWHAVTTDELAFPPLNGNAKEAAVFGDALKAAGKGSLEVCFRMSAKIKAELQAKLDDQAKKPNQGDMLTAMLGGLLQPLPNLDTATLIASGGAKGSRSAVASAHFNDDKSAKEFAGGVNGVIEMGKGMLGMSMAQFAKYGVDTKNANDMMASLVFKDAGKDASLALDDAFFGKFELFTQQMQAAQQKMMGDMKKGPGKAAPVADDEDDDDAALDQAEKDAAKK